MVFIDSMVPIGLLSLVNLDILCICIRDILRNINLITIYACYNNINEIFLFLPQVSCRVHLRHARMAVPAYPRPEPEENIFASK